MTLARSAHPLSRPWIKTVTAVTFCICIMARPAESAEKAPARIGILLTPYKAYQDTATALEAALKDAGHESIRVELPAEIEKPREGETATSGPASTEEAGTVAACGKLADANPSVIITCGTAATATALERIPRIPVVFCMVTNALDQPFLTEGNPLRSRLTGVITDISPADQVAWLGKVDPAARSIGVLYSDHTNRTAQAIAAAAKSRGVTLHLVKAGKDEFPKALDELNGKRCDGVLMLPDATIFNAATAQRLLLWGIRQQKRIWAFSANIVKAGALAGAYPDNGDLVRQTVELVGKATGNADLSKLPPEYPKKPQTAVNERTAELIGLSLSDELLEKVTTRFGKEK